MNLETDQNQFTLCMRYLEYKKLGEKLLDHNQ
jgi:hypothetical protein